MIKLDKVLHFLAGLIICAMFSTISPNVGMIITLAAGIMKELIDLYVRKTFFSWPDLVATILGGLSWVFIHGFI